MLQLTRREPKNNDHFNATYLNFFYSVTLNKADVKSCILLLSVLYQQESSTVRYYGAGSYRSLLCDSYPKVLLYVAASAYSGGIE